MPVELMQSALFADLRERGVRPVRLDIRQCFLATAAYVLLFVVLAWISDVRPLFAVGITPWSPQAGLTVAFLLLCGVRWLPSVAVAFALAEFLVRGAPAGPTLTVLGAFWMAAAYGVFSLVFQRLELARGLGNAKQAAKFAAAIVTGTFAISSIYVGILFFVGKLIASDVLPATARQWISDLNGILAVLPLLMLIPVWPTYKRLIWQHRWELLLQVGAVVAVLGVIFMLPAPDQLRFFYLLFVPLIWIALRWSWPGAVLAVLVIQLGLLIAAQTQIPTARFIDLQFLLLTLSLTGLFLGSVVAEQASMLRHVGMREAEQRALLEMAPDAVLAVDMHGTIRVANTAAVQMFGARATKHAGLADLLPKLCLEASAGRMTLEGTREDGATFPAEIAWARLDAPSNETFLVTVRDATERRRAEEQIRERDAALARAMRFAVAGELASALTHELNQPIGALVTYLQASEALLAQHTSEDERLRATFQKAAQEAIRAAYVLRRLRDFYQGGAFKREDVNVSTSVESVLQAFQERVRRHEVALDVEVHAGTPNVECDGTHLQIVLHNLLANALESVEQVPIQERKIAISASRVDADVTIAVEDSGPGLPEAIGENLFEPFTTSKPDGMGLGLAISRSLMRSRGGDLSYAPSSRLGGAAFTIRLPLDVPGEPSTE